MLIMERWMRIFFTFLVVSVYSHPTNLQDRIPHVFAPLAMRGEYGWNITTVRWSDRRATLDMASNDHGRYLMPPLVCEHEQNMVSQIMLGLIQTNKTNEWATIAKRNSFRASQLWHDRKYFENKNYPLEIRHTEISSAVLPLQFLVYWCISMAFLLVILLPVVALLFGFLTIIYNLLTSRKIRLRIRYLLIQRQKAKRKFEIIRTPPGYRLDHHYILPKFFRKDDEDEYPEELRKYDQWLREEYGREEPKHKIKEKFEKYMERRGLIYDPIRKRFRPKFEKGMDPKELEEFQNQLDEMMLKQAREILAHDAEYIKSIPEYRKLALELNIPYIEDEERSLLLQRVSKTMPKKKSKLSTLNPLRRVIKKRSKSSKSALTSASTKQSKAPLGEV